MHRRNVFAGPYLDRVAHLRHDADWLSAALADERSRAIPVWNSRSLVEDPAAEPLAAPAPGAGGLARAAFIAPGALGSPARPEQFIFLGSRGDAHYFAFEVDAPEPPELHPTARFQDLRMISSRLDAEGAEGIGAAVVEGPRGETVCVVEGDGTRLRRFHLRTASYANWPALAAATAGELLPDFPLINKSFELCYACVDR